jgi:uncharacterized membrane protein
MIEDLEALHAKLAELRSRVMHLREENQQLRQHLTTSQSEASGLQARMGTALQRIDALLAQLPATDGSERAD